MVCHVQRCRKKTGEKTGIPIVPAFVPPGKTKTAIMKQNQANARIIAQELEKAAMGQPLNASVIKSLAGPKKGSQILMGKSYMQGVSEYLYEWLKTRPETMWVNDWTAVERYAEQSHLFRASTALMTPLILTV